MAQGAKGGAFAGSVVGLVEAVWQLSAHGAPDGWAPVYAFVLYALIGLPFGAITGVLVTIAERWVDITEERAGANGAVGAIVPLSLFILRYLANKEIYLEQGVPLTGMVAILAVVGAISAMVLLAVPSFLRGPGKPLLRTAVSAGVWGAAALLLLGFAVFAPSGDPRRAWAHGKPVPAALADRPHVIVIMVDTLRADHLGPYGSTTVKTPEIDAFARDAIVFEEAFAQASWTRASGASLFTSRIPSGHAAATKAARLPDEAVTFAEVLQAAGVTTGALINNINMTETFNFDQGFDAFVYESPAYPFGGTESVFGLTMYKVVHKLGERFLKGSKRVESYYQPADVVLADAQGFVEANRDGRVALFVHLMEPHDPYFEHPVIMGTGDAEYNGIGFARAEVERPKPEQAEYMKQVYGQEIEFLDRKLGPFFSWLEAQGVYDDALIVITADHGEEFYEHGGFWHGTTLYDEQIHVPLIVKLPGNRHAGERVPWQVRSIDVAPTIAAAMGLPADPTWEGHDLIGDVDAWVAEKAAATATAEGAGAGSAVEGAPPPASGDPDQRPIPDAPVPEEVPLDGIADPCAADPRDRVVIAEEDFEGNQLHAIRHGGWKYIRANAGNPRGLAEHELFHVAGDGGETTNLAAQSAAVCGVYPTSRQKELDEALGKAIVEASKGAHSGGDAAISAEECERLKSLGYMDADAPCGG